MAKVSLVDRPNTYSQMKSGDVFRHNDVIFMRTDLKRLEDGSFWSVNLSNGRLTHFTDGYPIDGWTPVEIAITVNK